MRRVSVIASHVCPPVPVIDCNASAAKRALVTGGSSGIGADIVRRLVEMGYHVGVMDLNGEGGKTLLASLNGRGEVFAVDVSDYGAVTRAVEQFGAVDVLVNCAGWDKLSVFAESEPSLWEKIININLYGTLNVTRAVLPGMIAAKRGGRIINVASDAGRTGSTGEAVYSAAKGGVIAFTKSIARENAKHGILVNAVCPGITDTPLLSSMFDHNKSLKESLIRAIPLRRPGKPSEVAGCVAFLAGPDSTYITGQSISINGGLAM